MPKIFYRLSDYIHWQLLLVSVLAALVLLITAIATAAETPTVRIDGSSTVFPITEAVAEDFQTAQAGRVHVTVGVSGTGGGFKKFCRGETDVQDASRPIQISEMKDCQKSGVKYFELPIAFDAIAIVVNSQNTWMKEISVEDLRKIWEPAAQGHVMTWKQINPAWPNEPLHLFGPSSDNGTFDYFTEAVVGKARASRGDYNASADHNVVIQGVSRDKDALGFCAFSYAEENLSKIKILPVIGDAKVSRKTAPRKTAVMPSKETVENGTYFPLSRPIFIYVNEASSKRPEVKAFAEFYLQNAPSLVPDVKYFTLPAPVYRMDVEHLSQDRLGTQFGGHSQIGMKLEDLMKKEGKL
jgi:phosphate transport system substrate-binding protein